MWSDDDRLYTSGGAGEAGDLYDTWYHDITANTWHQMVYLALAVRAY
jgi:hypothetical protein